MSSYPNQPGQMPPVQPPQGGPPFGGPGYPPSNNRLAAGLCAILIGTLGIHKFIYGATTPGIIMLCVSLLTCGFGAPVIWIIGVIEGIIYLTKTDQEFYEIYQVGKKQWF